MSGSSQNTLRRYFYDPLNRLMGAGLTQVTGTQRFYQDGHLSTEVDPDKRTTIFRDQSQPLAQLQSAAGIAETALLLTDQAMSLLHALSSRDSLQLAFTAYGFHRVGNGMSLRVSFNGEPQDEVTRHYPLGRGNRFYNPVLMRFNSPDELSPFDQGWVNAYAYCGGDPVNFSDPSGNLRVKSAPRHLKRTPARPRTPSNISARTSGPNTADAIASQYAPGNAETHARLGNRSPAPGPSGNQAPGAPIATIKPDPTSTLRELVQQPVQALEHVPYPRRWLADVNSGRVAARHQRPTGTHPSGASSAALDSFVILTRTDTELVYGARIVSFDGRIRTLVVSVAEHGPPTSSAPSVLEIRNRLARDPYSRR